MRNGLSVREGPCHKRKRARPQSFRNGREPIKGEGAQRVTSTESVSLDQVLSENQISETRDTGKTSSSERRGKVGYRRRLKGSYVRGPCEKCNHFLVRVEKAKPLNVLDPQKLKTKAQRARPAPRRSQEKAVKKPLKLSFAEVIKKKGSKKGERGLH